MTWASFKTQLAERMALHRMTAVAISTTLGSNWDLRAAQYFLMFCRDTESCFSNALTLTLVTNDQLVDLSSASKVSGSKKVWKPTEIWIADARLTELPHNELVEAYNQATISAGVPTAYARMNNYNIFFNRACDTNYSGNVSGYVEHTALSADNVVLEIPDFDVNAAIDYCMYQFGGPMVADNVGLSVYANLEQRTYNQTRRILATNRKRHLSAFIRGA